MLKENYPPALHTQSCNQRFAYILLISAGLSSLKAFCYGALMIHMLLLINTCAHVSRGDTSGRRAYVVCISMILYMSSLHRSRVREAVEGE